MKATFTGALLLCTVVNLHAQGVLWQKDIKSSTQDFLNQVTATTDGQYLISGSVIQAKASSVAAQANKGYDYHLIKLNQQGNPVWEKYFSGKNHDYLAATIATPEGGFVLAGTSFSPKGQDKKEEAQGGSDIWIIKINEQGEELWQRTLGTPAHEEAKALVQTTLLDYFVAGTIRDPKNGFGSKDVWIVKLDKDGKPISQHILGGKGLDEIEKMVPTQDGGALLGIYSRSGISTTGVQKQSLVTSSTSGQQAKSSLPIALYQPKTTENSGEGDYWIVKLSKDGTIEWQKNFGGQGDDHIRTLSAITTPAFTGYIIGGESRSEPSGNKTANITEGTDIWLLALNENGTAQWQKSYSFKNRDILMGMSSLLQANGTTSKGILLGGYTQAEESIENNDETFWMLYLDPLGEEIWRKYVKGKSRKKEERLSDIKLNKDGSIVLAGTSTERLGKENWKIVKLEDEQVNQLIEAQDIKLYPNPAVDYTYVETGLDFTEAYIQVYDISGKLVHSQKTLNKVTKLNTGHLTDGTYLISITTESHQSASLKLIKQH